MKLPPQDLWLREWNIGEETYEVRFVSRFPGKDQQITGLCDGSSHTIYIKKGLTKNQALRTLLHELLHACEFEYDIKVHHRVIHQLEHALCNLLLSNF